MGDIGVGAGTLLSYVTFNLLCVQRGLHKPVEARGQPLLSFLRHCPPCSPPTDQFTLQPPTSTSLLLTASCPPSTSLMFSLSSFCFLWPTCLDANLLHILPLRPPLLLPHLQEETARSDGQPQAPGDRRGKSLSTSLPRPPRFVALSASPQLGTLSSTALYLVIAGHMASGWRPYALLPRPWHGHHHHFLFLPV